MSALDIVQRELCASTLNCHRVRRASSVAVNPTVIEVVKRAVKRVHSCQGVQQKRILRMQQQVSAVEMELRTVIGAPTYHRVRTQNIHP